MVNYKTIKIRPEVHEKLEDKKYELRKEILDDPSFNDTINYLLESSEDDE